MCVHKICGALLGVMTPCVGSATAYDQLCFGLLCVLFVCVDMFSGILYSSPCICHARTSRGRTVSLLGRSVVCRIGELLWNHRVAREATG